jgi:hypothetical protein
MLRGAQIPLCGLAGEYEKTLELAADRNLELSPPFRMHVAVNFWRGIAAARLATQAKGERRTQLLALLQESHDFLSQVAARGTPDNVEHKILMLQAERARAEGRWPDVADAMRRAAEVAQVRGYFFGAKFLPGKLGRVVAGKPGRPCAGAAAFARRRTRLPQRASHGLATPG